MSIPRDGGSGFSIFPNNSSPFSQNWTKPNAGPVAQSQAQAQQWAIQLAQQAAAAAKRAAEQAARAAAAARARAIAAKEAADKAAATAAAAKATQAQKDSAATLCTKAATDEATAEKKESTADVAAKDQALKESLLADMNDRRSPDNPSSTTVAAKSEYDAAVRNDALVNAPDKKTPTTLTDAKKATTTARKNAVDAAAVADAKAKGHKPSDAVAAAQKSQGDWFAAIQHEMRVAAVDASANGKDPGAAIDAVVNDVADDVKSDGYFDPASVRDALTKPAKGGVPSMADQAKAETPAQRQLLLEYESVQQEGKGRVSAAQTAYDKAEAAAKAAEKAATDATDAAKGKVQYGPYLSEAAARAAQDAPLDAPTGPDGQSARQLQAKAVQLRGTADAARTTLQTLEQAFGHTDPEHPKQDTLGLVQADYNKRGADLVESDAKQAYLETLDGRATSAQQQAAYTAWQHAVDEQTLATSMKEAIDADGQLTDAQTALATARTEQQQQVRAQQKPTPAPFSTDIDDVASKLIVTPKDPTVVLDVDNAADRAHVHLESGKYYWTGDDGTRRELAPATAKVWAANDRVDVATKADRTANDALKQTWTDRQPGSTGIDVTGELARSDDYTKALGTANTEVTQAEQNLRTAIDGGQSATLVQQRRVELGTALQARQLAQAQVDKIGAMQTLRSAQLWNRDAAGQPADVTTRTDDVRAAVQKVSQLQGTTLSAADESTLRETTLPQETKTLFELDTKIRTATSATGTGGGAPTGSAATAYRALLDQRDYLSHRIEAQKAQLDLIDTQRAALAAPFEYGQSTAPTDGVDLHSRTHGDAADAALTWGITPADDGRSVVLSGLPSNIEPEDVEVAKDGDGWYVTFDKSSGAYAMRAAGGGKAGVHVWYVDGSSKGDVAIEKGHRYRLNADAAQLWEATNTNPDAGDSALVTAQKRASAAATAVQLDPVTDATGKPAPSDPTVPVTADPKTIAATATDGRQPPTTIDFNVDQTGNKAAADARVLATGKALATAKAAIAAGIGDPQTLQAQLTSTQNASDLAVSEQSAVDAVLQWQQANYARQIGDANARAFRSPIPTSGRSLQEIASDQRDTATSAVAKWQSTKNRVDLAEADSAVATTQAVYDQWRSDHAYMLGSATDSAPYQDLQAAIARRDGAKRQLAAGAITTSDAAQKAFVANNLAPGQENDPHAMYQLFMKDPKTMAQSIINGDYAEKGGVPIRMQGRTEIANRVAMELGFRPSEAFDPNDPAGLQRVQTQNLFTTLTHDQQDALDRVVDQVVSAGGDQAEVTVLPVIYAIDADKDEGGGIVKTALFKVQDKDHPDEVKYVDEYGKRYDSIHDYRFNNNLPVDGVNLVMPEDGNFTLDDSGNVKLYADDARDESGWDHFRRKTHLDAIVGGLAIVGGVLLEFGSAGTLTPVAGAMILGGASLYGIATSAEALQNRSAHGQSINPFTDREAGMDWLNLGASALALPSVGSAGRAANLMWQAKRAGVALNTVTTETSQVVSMTGKAAMVTGGAAMADGGAYMAQNWDQMDSGQKWEQGGMFLLNLASMGTHPAAESFKANARNRIATAEADGVPVKPPVVDPSSTRQGSDGADAIDTGGTPILAPADGTTEPIATVDPARPVTGDRPTPEPTVVDREPTFLPVLEMPSSAHRDDQVIVDGINNTRKTGTVATAAEITRAVRPKAVDGGDNDVASTDASTRRDTARASYDRLNLDGENAIKVMRGPRASDPKAVALLNDAAVVELSEQSPTLRMLLSSAETNGVKLRIGVDGASSTELDAGGGETVVSIGRSHAESPETFVNVLAHELGHAHLGMSETGIAHEGRVRLWQLRVRDEIITSGGPDIFPQAPHEDLAIYAEAKRTGNDDEAAIQLGELMAGRRMSTDPTKTYGEAYRESPSVIAFPDGEVPGPKLPPGIRSDEWVQRDSGILAPRSASTRGSGEDEVVHDLHAHHGGKNAGGYGASRDDAPSLETLLDLTRGNVLFQRVPQTAQPYYLNLGSDGFVFEGHLTLRTDNTIHLDKEIVFKDDAAPAIRPGVYTRARLEELGLRFDHRFPAEAPRQPITMKFNVEPGLAMGYRGLQRDVGLIDQVRGGVENQDAQRRAYIGLTAGDPAALDNVEALFGVLDYANLADPTGDYIRIPGLGETTVAKEGVTKHLALRPDLLNPGPIDRLASQVGEMGGLMIVHADSGTTRVIGAPGNHGLLVHGPSDYFNVEPLLAFFRRHPNVEFVWAHAGGLGRTVEPGPEHIRMLDTVLLDESLTHVHIDLSWDVVARYLTDRPMQMEWKNLINKHSGRFLYGSDSVAASTPEIYTATYREYDGSGFLGRLEDRDALLRGNFQRLVETSTEKVTAWRLRKADMLQYYRLRREDFVDPPLYLPPTTDGPGRPTLLSYPDEPLGAAGDPPEATMVKGSQWPDLLAQMKSGRLSADGDVYVYRMQDSAMDPATPLALDAASRRLQGWMHLPQGSTKPRWLGQSDPGTSPGVRADGQRKLGGMGTEPWSDQVHLIVSRTSPQALRETGRIDDVRWVGPDVDGIALRRPPMSDAPESVAARPAAESIPASTPEYTPADGQGDATSPAAANDPDRKKFSLLFGASTVGALGTGAAASMLTHPASVLDPNVTGSLSFIYRGVVGAGRARLAQRIDAHVRGLQGEDAPRHLDWLERTVVRKGGLLGIPQSDRTTFGAAVSKLRTDGSDEAALAAFDGTSKKLLSPGTAAGRINDTLQLTTLALNNANSAAWFGQHGFDASSPQAWSTAAFLGANLGLSTVNFAGRLGYRAGLQSIRDRVTMKVAQVGVMSGYASGSLPLAFTDATTAPGPLGFTKAALDLTFGTGAGWQAGRDVRTGVRSAQQKQPLSYRVAPMVILGTGVAARMALQLFAPASGNGPSPYAQPVPSTGPTVGPTTTGPTASSTPGSSTVPTAPSTSPSPTAPPGPSPTVPSGTPPSVPEPPPSPPPVQPPPPPPVQPPPPPPPPPSIAKPVVVEAGDRSTGTLWGIAEANEATLLTRGAIEAARRQGGDDAVVATALKQLFQLNPERHFDVRLMDGIASAAEGDPDTIQPGWKINVDRSALSG